MNVRIKQSVVVVAMCALTLNLNGMMRRLPLTQFSRHIFAACEAIKLQLLTRKYSQSSRQQQHDRGSHGSGFHDQQRFEQPFPLLAASYASVSSSDESQKERVKRENEIRERNKRADMVIINRVNMLAFGIPYSSKTGKDIDAAIKVYEFLVSKVFPTDTGVFKFLKHDNNFDGNTILHRMAALADCSETADALRNLIYLMRSCHVNPYADIIKEAGHEDYDFINMLGNIHNTTPFFIFNGHRGRHQMYIEDKWLFSDLLAEAMSKVSTGIGPAAKAI